MGTSTARKPSPARLGSDCGKAAELFRTSPNSSVRLTLSQNLEQGVLPPFRVCVRDFHDGAPQLVGDSLEIDKRHVPDGWLENTNAMS